MEELDSLLARQPSDSPSAVTAWMARQLADQIITAFRTMDRASAWEAIEDIAYHLETLADAVDPDAVVRPGTYSAFHKKDGVWCVIDHRDHRSLKVGGVTVAYPDEQAAEAAAARLNGSV